MVKFFIIHNICNYQNEFLLQNETSVGVFEGLMAGSNLTKQEYQELRSTLSQNCMLPRVHVHVYYI